MEADVQGKTMEPTPLSRVLFSANNPFVSSAKGKKRPAGSKSKFEFVQIVPDNHEKHERNKKSRTVADTSSGFFKGPSTPAVEKAKVIEASLSQEHPSFIKRMQPSNVSHTFFLHLPSQFCKSHLPFRERTLLDLEDENGKQFKTTFLPHSTSFSGGWRAFSVSENLQKDDVLVFHLVQPCKFKVYIIRANDFEATEKDLATPKSRENNLKRNKASQKPKVVEKNIYEDVEPNDFISENYNPQTISTFKNFKIVVNNQTINFEISPHIRNRYFFLCRTQKKFLHCDLVKGISTKLAASIISETTDIADAIRNSEIFAPREGISYWNTTLQTFEFLGMDVGFIRARLNRLLEIAQDCSKSITDWKKERNAEGEFEGARIEEKIRYHEKEIEELKNLKRRIEMRGKKSMDEIVEKCKVIYEEEAKAPW